MLATEQARLVTYYYRLALPSTLVVRLPAGHSFDFVCQLIGVAHLTPNGFCALCFCVAQCWALTASDRLSTPPGRPLMALLITWAARLARPTNFLWLTSRGRNAFVFFFFCWPNVKLFFRAVASFLLSLLFFCPYFFFIASLPFAFGL